MMRRGWNMWPKTALTLFCLVFAASFIPRSDAEVEEAELVGGKANVDTSSDKDASHALVYDATNFRSEIDRRRMHFVMLFKSRDAEVRSLERTFDKLAKKFNTKESMERIVLAKISCVDQNSELCEEVAINEEAALVIFDKNGSPQSVYSGNQDYESLNNFLEELLGAYMEDLKEVPVPKPKKSLVELTEETFDEQIAVGHAFIKFYAPWCGHCQSLAPVWEELAKSFEHSDWLTVGKVDCTQFGQLCARNNVRGYPTLIYFTKGKKHEEYNGARDHSSLKQYVLRNKQRLGADAGLDDGDQFTDEGIPIRDYVIPLTDETFVPRISEGTNFVMFFDPDCSHCEALESDWKSLALVFVNKGVVVSKLDCTKYEDTCSGQAISSFPTLIMYSNGRRLEKYDGILNYNSIKEFVFSMKDKSADDGISPDEVSFVVELDNSNFDEYIEAGYCLVNFFKPWCDFCKNLAPVWQELALKLSNERAITIAKVDCSISDVMCEERGVKGYPTIMLYNRGTMKDFYTGAHDLESLYNYVVAQIHHMEF